MLYFGRSDALRAYAGFFDLPPTPPEDAFDARFSSGSMVWIPRPGDPTDAATINVQCSLYPLNVSWKIPPSEGAYSLTVGPRSHPTELAGSGSITVSDPGTKVLRLQSGGEGNSRAFPKQYGLEQNYPNPFNPSTSVEYRIPADGRVKLEIFNLIGQQVRVLVDKDQRAGSYTAEWDGRSSRGFGLTSGIYFVRLTVNSAGKQAFTSTKKMILMR